MTTATATVTTTATVTRLTAAEFEKQYADVPFCELERGEVMNLTVGGWKHSSICLKVGALLYDWVRRTKLGRILGNEAGLITERDPDTVRGMDVAYFSFQRVPVGKEPEGFAEIAPELAVEVVGKGQGWKKMVEKAGEYLALGVDRVWIIDPRSQSLHVFRADGEPIKLTVEGMVQDEAVLPDFSCKLAEFFEE